MELWFSEFHAPDVKHSIRVNRHLYSHKSPYQQIDIYVFSFSVFRPDIHDFLLP